MKRSIFLKVFGGYLLITFTLALLILVFAFKVTRTFYLDTLSHDLENLGGALKLQILPFLEDNRIEELDSFVKNFGKNINTRITIINREGRVLADSDEDPRFMENHKSRPEIYRALTGRVGKSLRFSTTVKEEMLYVGLPVERNGEISNVLRVSLYIKNINQLLSNLRTNIWRIVLLISLVSLIGAFIFSRSLSKPIRELSHASQRVASGDFETKVFLKNRDELKELAQCFNFMTERIKTSFREQSRQKEELNSILSSIQEGILALDKKGKILFSNESFRRISQEDIVKGKFCWEVLRESQFDEFVKKVQEQKKNNTEEITIKERIFLCSAVFLSPREEVIVTLYDLTKDKNIEKMKKDFIVNVSHELRTPLTAIKGFVETLEAEISDRNRNHLAIIKKHTDRLINIVKDLLLLSELEEKDIKLEVEKVDLKNLMENILKIFEKKLKEKNLEAKIRAEGDNLLVKGDPFKLEQMFINIIDNAVNHTEKGNIVIFLKKKDRGLSIEIQDTGIGIPEEHLSRIFERFYVVDKSRSRALGGTGLGLSIVKHIVLLHKGKVSVDSTVGEGTKFTVLLPA